MFTVRNLSTVSYSNLIGQRQEIVSNTDQPEAPPEHCQNWSMGPDFDHFAQCKWSLPNKRRNTAKCNQKANARIDITRKCCYVLI